MASRGSAARSRVLARLASLAQIGELVRRLPSPKNPHFQNEAKCTALSCENEFNLPESKKSFPNQRLSTYFDTKALWNSQMTNSKRLLWSV